MAASYPTSSKAFTTKTNGPTSTIDASHVNDLQAEVTAVEQDLIAGLPVARGGTGNTTLTANRVLIGNGTSAVSVVAGEGTTGQVLTSNGASAPTFQDLPKGKVVQIVAATTSTGVSNSTSTYADTNLTATITPTSASNKVLVVVQQTGLYKTGTDTSIALKLLRGSTDLAVFEQVAGLTGSTVSVAVGGSGVVYLDSPATTSATTYKTQFKSVANSASVAVQVNNSVSSILLVEVTP